MNHQEIILIANEIDTILETAGEGDYKQQLITYRHHIAQILSHTSHTLLYREFMWLHNNVYEKGQTELFGILKSMAKNIKQYLDDDIEECTQSKDEYTYNYLKSIKDKANSIL